MRTYLKKLEGTKAIVNAYKSLPSYGDREIIRYITDVYVSPIYLNNGNVENNTPCYFIHKGVVLKGCVNNMSFVPTSHDDLYYDNHDLYWSIARANKVRGGVDHHKTVKLFIEKLLN